MDPATQQATNTVQEPVSRPGSIKSQPLALLQGMRPVQWLKNLLLAVPLVTAHEWANLDKLTALLVAFVSFSLAASSVYLVNDVIDAQHDRLHPTKRNRPIASGRLSVPVALVAALVLIGAAVGIAYFVRGWFLELLLVYLVLTASYSFYFKSKPVLDAIFLAGLYTHRIVIGGEAIDEFPTPWLLAFSMFMFLSLALAKRHAELTLMQAAGKEAPANRGYHTRDIPLLAAAGIAAGYAGVMVFALYINSITNAQFYELPQLLWFICPLLIYWITRIWLLSNRGRLRDDPLMFTVTDRVSWFIGLCSVMLVVIAAG